VGSCFDIIQTMDVYLSREARQYLKALPVVSVKAHGFLIGHKRGHRFFVEKILPSSRSSSLSLQKQLQLNKLLEDRIIGFYSFNADKGFLDRILVPHATGKLFLKIMPTEGDGLTINPLVIDYDERFHLLPIKITSL
jgi:hypothetical protein